MTPRRRWFAQGLLHMDNGLDVGNLCSENKYTDQSYVYFVSQVEETVQGNILWAPKKLTRKDGLATTTM